MSYHLLHGHDDGCDSRLELSPGVEHPHTLQALAQLTLRQLVVSAHDPRVMQRLLSGNALRRVHRQHPKTQQNKNDAIIMDDDHMTTPISAAISKAQPCDRRQPAASQQGREQ